MNYSFINTIIATDSFKEKVEYGNFYLIRFDAVKDELLDAYTCVECCVPLKDYDEEAVKNAYKEWKELSAERELAFVIREKIREIIDYDVSDKVNGFKLNGLTVWLDKETRVGLMNSTTIAKNAGLTITTLWLNGIKLEVECDKAILLLSALEMYALECFNVTASHKKQVSELTTIEDVKAFDITKDYPEQLNMTV